MWFAQAETQFTLARVSSEKIKLCHVILQLDHRYPKDVEDIVSSLPDQYTYTKLRTELVKRLSLSTEQRTLQLHTLEEMGDKSRQVSEAPQEPCPRRARRLPPKLLVQPATPQHTGHFRRPARGQLERRNPLCGTHLRNRNPAGDRTSEGD
jgi:hypothetical protein